MNVAGSAHFCKSPVVAYVGSKPFSSRRPSSEWRSHFRFTHGRRSTPHPRTVAPRAQQEGTEVHLISAICVRLWDGGNRKYRKSTPSVRGTLKHCGRSGFEALLLTNDLHTCRRNRSPLQRKNQTLQVGSKLRGSSCSYRVHARASAKRLISFTANFYAVTQQSGGPPLEKGQGTAIVTGAISIIFGVSAALHNLLSGACWPSFDTLCAACCASPAGTRGALHEWVLHPSSSKPRCTGCAHSHMESHHLYAQVLYLVLVQLLDTRGNQLEPPPPEAFEQGHLFLLRDLF